MKTLCFHKQLERNLFYFLGGGRLPNLIIMSHAQKFWPCITNSKVFDELNFSKHAEHIAGEIFHEAMKLEHKSSTLHQRIERLTAKVSGLDINSDQGRFLINFVL